MEQVFEHKGKVMGQFPNNSEQALTTPNKSEATPGGLTQPWANPNNPRIAPNNPEQSRTNIEQYFLDY